MIDPAIEEANTLDLYGRCHADQNGRLSGCERFCCNEQVSKELMAEKTLHRILLGAYEVHLELRRGEI
ncbi:hypothetical protein NPIL_604631 [Nephila pilipes]|uniref:Uncharacterized protein n=1 Tax=Nephila pilipes TaxID=299642 RepID=A0A8X6M6B4_NEPPI|nr:hypothetical protein NPIL_604631 [Nephila pilipes]